MFHSQTLWCVAGLMMATSARADDRRAKRSAAKHPICAQDLSAVALPDQFSGLSGPAGLEGSAIRPGMLRVQQDLCRCLPRKRHQPAMLRAELHIRPNEGQVDIRYLMDTSLTKPQKRMRSCLGGPTLQVTPMPYKTDMVTADGPVDEVLKYPIHMILDEEAAKN